MSRQTMSFALPESMREYIDTGSLPATTATPASTSVTWSAGIRKSRPKSGFATSSRKVWRPGPAVVAPRRTRRTCWRSLAARSIEAGGSAPQAVRDQQGEVRYYRKEGGTRVAVKLATTTTPRLTRSNSILASTHRRSESFLAFQGFGLGGWPSSRCSGATSNAEITLMWSGCWASARTSPLSWATSSLRTDGTHVAARSGPAGSRGSPAALYQPHVLQPQQDARALVARHVAPVAVLHRADQRTQQVQAHTRAAWPSGAHKPRTGPEPHRVSWRLTCTSQTYAVC